MYKRTAIATEVRRMQITPHGDTVGTTYRLATSCTAWNQAECFNKEYDWNREREREKEFIYVFESTGAVRASKSYARCALFIKIFSKLFQNNFLIAEMERFILYRNSQSGNFIIAATKKLRHILFREWGNNCRWYRLCTFKAVARIGDCLVISS